MTWRRLGAVATILLLCGCRPEAAAPSQNMAAAPRSRTTAPLKFQTTWVRGTMTADRAANSSTEPLDLTISLQLHSATQAMAQTPGTPFEGRCFHVRVLHRSGPDAPSRFLDVVYPHQGPLWSSAPLVCVHVGMEWTWRFVIPGAGGALPDAAGRERLVLASSDGRSATEQFAMAVIRQPIGEEERLAYAKSFETFIVAKSDWVSLNP